MKHISSAKKALVFSLIALISSASMAQVAFAANPYAPQATGEQPSIPTAVTTQSTEGSFSFFGGSKKTTKLAISDIVVSSGPRNIYNSVSSANCSAVISWNTSVPAAGGVVYGETSQQNATEFNYTQAAIETASFSTVHQVTLPTCLEEKTYYFRVIAMNAAARVVSDEMPILAIPVETTNFQTVGSAGSLATASIFDTMGKFFLSPIVLFVILGIIVFFVVRKFRSRDEEVVHEPAHEPTLVIPHH